MGKTIFNNLNIEVKSQIKSLFGSQSNNTNDPYINKIVSELENVCVTKIIKSQYFINIMSYSNVTPGVNFVSKISIILCYI